MLCELRVRGTRRGLLCNRHGRGAPIHRDVARLAGHPLEPGADLRETGQVEVALMRHVRIGVERDVGDGVAVRREETMAPEVLFHDAERLVAALHPILERVPLQLPAALDSGAPEARGAQVWLE